MLMNKIIICCQSFVANCLVNINGAKESTALQQLKLLHCKSEKSSCLIKVLEVRMGCLEQHIFASKCYGTSAQESPELQGLVILQVLHIESNLVTYEYCRDVIQRYCVHFVPVLPAEIVRIRGAAIASATLQWTVFDRPAAIEAVLDCIDFRPRAEASTAKAFDHRSYEPRCL